MTSRTPFEPGSIKDRLLLSTFAIGPNATREALHKCVEGQSPIIEIAIDALVRDGYLRKTFSPMGQIFAVNDEMQEVLQQYMDAAKPPTPPPADPPDQSNQEPDMTTTTTTDMKICHGKHSVCKVKEQPASNFYTGQACCKECSRAAAAKYSPPKAKTTKAKTVKAKTVKKPQVLEELVIPNSGQITCTRIESGVKLSQDNDVIVCSAGQLAALYNYIGAYMEMEDIKAE